MHFELWDKAVVGRTCSHHLCVEGTLGYAYGSPAHCFVNTNIFNLLYRT